MVPSDTVQAFIRSGEKEAKKVAGSDKKLYEELSNFHKLDEQIKDVDKLCMGVHQAHAAMMLMKQ